MPERMGGLDARMGGLDARMGGLEARMGGLEARVGGLEARVGSLETQFLQFRQETRSEFSAVRKEMRDLHEDGKAFALQVRDDVMAQVRVLHEDLVDRIKTLRQG
jgi:hypothetical protein